MLGNSILEPVIPVFVPVRFRICDNRVCEEAGTAAAPESRIRLKPLTLELKCDSSSASSAGSSAGRDREDPGR